MTREEAATYIKDHVMWGAYNQGEYKEALGMAIKALEQIKNNYESMTGHWKYYRNNKGEWINECNVCRSDIGVGYQYPYCPYCGAIMNDPQESEVKE